VHSRHIVILSIASLLHTGESKAATFCVQSSVQLQNALSDAEANSESDEIRVRSGQYAAPPGGWLTDLKDGSKGLALIGGYTDATCTETSRTSNALGTVLDGGGQSRILTIETSESFGMPSPDSTVKVTGFTFQNGVDAQIAALKISDPGPIYGGNILIEGNIFRNNTTTAAVPFEGVGPAVLAATDGPDFNGGTGLIVRNNLFAENVGGNASAAFLFSNNRIALSNNTFARNQSDDPGAQEQFVIQFFTFTGLSISNNVFWDNNPEGSPGRFDIQLSDDTDLLNNNIESSIGAPATNVGTTAVDPTFLNAGGGDYSLAGGSLMIDTGSDAPPSGLAPNDVVGQQRTAGSHVDRGAFEFVETEAIFLDGFESP
jgi:hypothetical protein